MLFSGIGPGEDNELEGQSSAMAEIPPKAPKPAVAPLFFKKLRRVNM
jgi:hypothetical protein